ncbi:glycoside hydrolase family 43 protein [Nocardioides mangrovicus]|uniref:glycoside hydrolase family 43 protein n=1 Tax=Nocardioides mangrovicus TaxID=2478913 RepID=UPI001314EE56|nr:glycoside hydrolase family 43 protein [Nocardioides mangrovicus]
MTGLLAAALTASTLPAAQAVDHKPNPKGSDPFTAGTPYTGDFPDPTVLRIGSTYFAYSTTTANINLPLLTSHDLSIWTTRPSYTAGSATDNDALPDSPVWASQNTVVNGHRKSPVWAPSVARIQGRYVAAYATQLADHSRYCISTARAGSPWGPFTDTSAGPLVCPAHQGAIDPSLFRYKGKNWLLYKTEGNASTPPKIWSRQLNKYATGFAHRSKARVLLKPKLAWEGGVIENPAMVVWRKRLYLFYSANNWASDRYRIGYSLCTSMVTKCKRLTRYPLMRNSATISGPGGESPFVDAHGLLRMAYHAWTPGNIGYPTTTTCLTQPSGCAQRRMHIARLVRVPGTKRLRLADYGARFGT